MSAELTQRLAMTGASGFLGKLALGKLVNMPSVQEVHVCDIKPPSLANPKILYHRVDLTKEGCDAELAAILLKNNIKTFIHGALFSGPQRQKSWAREVESIGTFHVLNALAEAQVQRCLVTSATFVYGAQPDNPNFIREDFHLRSIGPSFVKTRVDVEKQLAEFSRDYPETKVTVLRMAPILGPNSSQPRARYFVAGLIPKLLGYDPLLQFVHEDDAVQALLLALRPHAPSGVFNIVGKGVLPLSTAVHISGRLPIPVPQLICKTVFALGYGFRLWDLPASMLPFFQYLCVADGTKARGELGFVPQFSGRQALKSMIESYRLRNIGFEMPSSSFGEDEAAVQQNPGFLRLPEEV